MYRSYNNRIFTGMNEIFLLDIYNRSTYFVVIYCADNQRLKWLKIGLFWVFGYNYRMNDKVARIGKYSFTRAYIGDIMV